MSKSKFKRCVRPANRSVMKKDVTAMRKRSDHHEHRLVGREKSIHQSRRYSKHSDISWKTWHQAWWSHVLRWSLLATSLSAVIRRIMSLWGAQARTRTEEIKTLDAKLEMHGHMMKYATVWAETRPLCVSCVACLSIRGWCSAQQFGVVTKQPLFRWVPTLYRASQGWKWISQKVMPVPWRIDENWEVLARAIVCRCTSNSDKRFALCEVLVQICLQRKRREKSVVNRNWRWKAQLYRSWYTYTEIIQTFSRYFCDSEQGMLFALWQWALWTQGYGVVGGDLQLDGLQAQSWEIFLYLTLPESACLRQIQMDY